MPSAADASDPADAVGSYVVPGLASSPFGGGALTFLQASGAALSELADVSWVAISGEGHPMFTPPAWLDETIAAKDPDWRITVNERFPRGPAVA